MINLLSRLFKSIFYGFGFLGLGLSVEGLGVKLNPSGPPEAVKRVGLGLAASLRV